MPLMILDKKSGWAKVQDLDGEVHWAKQSDLNTKDRCVVVKVNVATPQSHLPRKGRSSASVGLAPRAQSANARRAGKARRERKDGFLREFA